MYIYLCLSLSLSLNISAAFHLVYTQNRLSTNGEKCRNYGEKKKHSPIHIECTSRALCYTRDFVCESRYIFFFVYIATVAAVAGIVVVVSNQYSLCVLKPKILVSTPVSRFIKQTNKRTNEKIHIKI